MTDEIYRPRLFLVTPRQLELEVFAPRLEAALAAGDVASLLIAPDAVDDALQEIAEKLVPIAQEAGVAALIRNDTRITGRVKADGIHVDSGEEDLKEAIERFQPRHFVGAGNLANRHQAMLAGELGADYVFFGRIDHDERPHAHPRDLEFAAWWSEVFEPPCVVLAGSDLADFAATAESGSDFIALRNAVWDHADGPAAAVAAANAVLDRMMEDV
ncbi:MAG: thiamine phosphate synthase [Hyphomicrobiales bacterium]|nr:MAG: thiamine phosphate synthase [Hyphomicrobiales bacterium]